MMHYPLLLAAWMTGLLLVVKRLALNIIIYLPHGSVHILSGLA